jgi:ATPase subunit of ABC transporter with duplicated ATPase domains
VLFSAPDLLLLDEPTNYLDLEGALWLEAYLVKYPHTVIVISHDRALLNRSVGAILHLEDRKLTLYQGPYDTFARTRAEQRAVQAAEARKQDARRAHMQSFVDRFRYKASKAKQAQARLKMIEKMTPIAAPEEAARRVFTFAEPEELSPPIVALEGAAVGYDATPCCTGSDLRIDQDDRIALLGRNGEGKSTLSKLLSGPAAGTFGPESSGRTSCGSAISRSIRSTSAHRGNPAAAPAAGPPKHRTRPVARPACGLRADGGSGRDRGRPALGRAKGAAVAACSQRSTRRIC